MKTPSLARTSTRSDPDSAQPMGNMVEALGDATADAQQPKVDLEEYGAQYLRRAVREKHEAMWREFFGPVLIDTDWNFPSIAHNRDRVEKVLAWQYGQRGLMVYGKSGGGKSRAICALCRRLIVDEGIDTALWKSQRLYSHMTRLQGFGQDRSEEFIEGLAERRLLVIEDFGQEGTTQNLSHLLQQWFFELLDRRYSLGLPCIITTNYTSRIIAETMKGLNADPLTRRLQAVGEPVMFRSPKLAPEEAA